MMVVLRLFLIPLAFCLLTGQAQAQPQIKEDEQQSVERGLAFLALLQEKDGAWQGDGGNKHPAVTALALLAFLSAGHVPGEGPYQANVAKGIGWLLQQQQPNGLFCLPGGEEMYQHGISTLLLAQAAGMTDAKSARRIKPKLEKAVQLILQGQRQPNDSFQGGWRYRLDSPDADISVTGWQIMALRAAKNLGCDVPAERIEEALRFVQRCRDGQSGGFAYMPGAPPTLACTGTCMLALELAGKQRHRSQEALQGATFLLRTPLKYQDKHFFYAAYYTSQAMFQLGGNYWKSYRPRLYKELLGQQKRNGSWSNNDATGTSYNIAMAILALTVEYRFLPIYQRNEDADSPKKQDGSVTETNP